MGRFATWSLVVLLFGANTSSVFAGNAKDPFQITAKEKAACTTDAVRFCAYTYPDATQLIGCMKSNRGSLSATCLAAFDAGMKRRHLE